MENQIIDSDSIRTQQGAEEQPIISSEKFVLLSILTFGIYNLWWTYKAWRYFKIKENSDIIPVARTIFGIIFLGFLFQKVLDSAKEKGYPGNYSPWLLFAGVVIVGLLGQLPVPFSLMSVFGFIFFLPVFKALNYVKQNSTAYGVQEQASFNTRQIVLIIFGVLLWILVLAGLSLEQSGY